MPEPKRIKVVYEGDADRAVLRGLVGYRLLPDHVEPADRPAGGKDELARAVAPYLPMSAIDGLAGRTIALRDADDLSAPAIGSWFLERLREHLSSGEGAPRLELVDPQAGARMSKVEVTHGDRRGRVAVISVGLPEDAPTNLGITRFAMDDYVLRLARDEKVYAGRHEMDAVPYATAFAKLARIVALLRDNGLQVADPKRLCHLLRGVTGFQASQATFAECLIRTAGEENGTGFVADVFRPLLDDMTEATAWLASAGR
jgi:hypothetical protein